jgi:hypothetical protein
MGALRPHRLRIGYEGRLSGEAEDPESVADGVVFDVSSGTILDGDRKHLIGFAAGMRERAQSCKELLVEVGLRLTDQSMRIGLEGRLFHLACIRFVPEGRLFFADAQHVVEIVGGKRPLQKPSILEVSDVGKDAARLAETGPDMATARRRTGVALPGERRGLGAALRAFGADAPLPRRRLSRFCGVGSGLSVAAEQARFAMSPLCEAGDFIELHEGARARAAVDCSESHIRRPCGGPWRLKPSIRPPGSPVDTDRRL